MEWNKVNTLFLLQLIRERPVIWDASLEEHKNKHKRLDALSEIGKTFNVTKEEINSKWISLKGQYNREKRKVTELKTGSGADDIYVSKWFAYQEMADLLSCNIPQDSISNYTMSLPPPPAIPTPPPFTPTPPPPTPTPPPFTPTPPPPTPTPPPSTSTPPPTTPTQPPLRVKGSDSIKRKRNSDLYGEALLTLKAIKERKSKTPELEDEITTYGLYIAAQMRKFEPILQSKLKLDIQSLLYKYEIENMEYTTRSESSMIDNSEINNLNNVSYSASPSSPTESSTYRQLDTQIMPTTSLTASTNIYRQLSTQIMPISGPIVNTSTYEQPDDIQIMATTASTGPTASTSAYRLPDIQSSIPRAIQSNSYLVISNDRSIKEVTDNLQDSLPQVVLISPAADTSETESTLQTKEALEHLLKFY